MLSKQTRIAILELAQKDHSIRQIAKALEVSREAVKKVIGSQSREPPQISRPSLFEPHRETILELHASCRGNLVRVHEELQEKGVMLSYPALTAFCRRQGIGQKPIRIAGRYHFEPGQEMQHDTSPHTVIVGGKKCPAQTAVAALCYSRMKFFQSYPKFRRFECKIFLTEALKDFDGVPETTMIDNTGVVVSRGTGSEMVPAPEMEVFAERFGFVFKAHEKGDVNRSAHAERSFWHYETNFLAGRSFADWHDLNQQARQWNDKINNTYKRHLKAKPVDLFALERAHLRRLPIWIPEPYEIWRRTVDVEGYVTVNTNRYSVPVSWIGRQVDVRETWDRIEIELRHQPTVTHRRVIEAIHKRSTLPQHRLARGQGRKRKGTAPEEKTLRQTVPTLAGYVDELKRRGKKQTLLALRQMLRMVREYPRQPLLRGFERAARYGLYDLDRVERIVLRHIAEDYFRLDPDPKDENDPGDQQ
jgi:transposase